MDRFGCLTGGYRHSWRQAFWFSPLWFKIPLRQQHQKRPRATLGSVYIRGQPTICPILRAACAGRLVYPCDNLSHGWTKRPAQYILEGVEAALGISGRRRGLHGAEVEEVLLGDAAHGFGTGYADVGARRVESYTYDDRITCLYPQGANVGMTRCALV